MSQLDEIKSELQEKFEWGIKRWSTSAYGVTYDRNIPSDERYLDHFSVLSVDQLDGNTLLVKGELTVGFVNCNPSYITVDYKATFKKLLDEYEIVKIVNNRENDPGTFYYFFPFNK